MGAQAVRLSNIDIDNAFEQRDFEVLFQPIFNLNDGSLSRMESFIRWRHSSLGILPPGAFISFFESQGRMSELSRYVLDESFKNYLEWRGNYGPGFSINLALTDLQDEALASHLTVLLREYNFPANEVTLECPMPPVTVNQEAAKNQFLKLKETGARLAIEVRGRANDFIREVSPFPFDEIKTGGAAILRFARTVRGPGLSAISELLDIAKDNQCAIAAVGVEDQASLRALCGLGFNAAQGNHLGKVGPLKDFKSNHINTVRERLELSPISDRQLNDLFREQPKTDNNKKTSSLKQSNAPAVTDNAPTSNETNIDNQQIKESQISKDQVSKDQTSKDQASITPQSTTETTAERAKRKASILAQRKGSDVLRAELAARREKLGLTPSKEINKKPPAAARGLQDRLSTEFVNDGDKPKATQPSPLPLDKTKDNEAIMPNPLLFDDQEQIETLEESEHPTDETREAQSSDTKALAPSKDTQDIERDSERDTESVEGEFKTQYTESSIAEKLDVKNLDANNQEAKNEKIATKPEPTPSSDNKGQTEEIIAEPSKTLTTESLTPAKPEIPLEPETPLELESRPPELENPSGLEVSAEQEISIEQDGFADSINPEEKEIGVQLPNAPRKLALQENFKSNIQIKNVEAYQIAITNVQIDEDNVIEYEKTSLQENNLQEEKQSSAIEDSIFLISPNDLVPKGPRKPNKTPISNQQSAPVPTQNSEPKTLDADDDAGDYKPLRLNIVDGPEPTWETDSDIKIANEITGATTNLYDDDYENIDDQSDDKTQEPLPRKEQKALALKAALLNHDNGTLDNEDNDTTLIASENEAAMFEESLLLAKQAKIKRKKNKNFLTRKYRIWPTHFWPRSWSKAWARRAENRDFVRRAKEMSTRLTPADEPADEIEAKNKPTQPSLSDDTEDRLF